MFSGQSDFDVSVELAEKLSIPVIHSGDIRTLDDTIFFKDTAVKGLMVGRGVLGAPWIFRELKGEVVTEDEKKFYIKKHLSYYMRRDVDKRFGHLMIKKHASWYSSKKNGASNFRKMIFESGGDFYDTVKHVNDFFGIDL
jgi:tRNA-dihydrouridine synthase B